MYHGSQLDLQSACILQLFDVTSARFGIDISQSCPDVCSSVGFGEDWLNRLRDGSENSAVYQFVLAFVEDMFWIWSILAINGDNRWWKGLCGIKKNSQVVTVKENMDLTAPHEVVGSIKLGDVGCIDIE